MILYTYRDLTIRTLADEDAALLVKWLNDPHVLEYYEGRDRPHDMAMVHKHFYERTFEITQCIVQYKGRVIGYIQERSGSMKSADFRRSCCYLSGSGMRERTKIAG